MRPARRRVGEPLERDVLGRLEVAAPEVGLQLARARGRAAAHARIVARIERQQQRVDAAGHQHDAEQERQESPHYVAAAFRLAAGALRFGFVFASTPAAAPSSSIERSRSAATSSRSGSAS